MGTQHGIAAFNRNRRKARAEALEVRVEVRCVLGEWQLFHGCDAMTFHLSRYAGKAEAQEAMRAYVAQLSEGR